MTENEQYYATDEAEKHIAGCLLVRPHDTVEEIRSVVAVSDFENSFCRDVYRAVLDLMDANETVDPVTIQQKMESYGRAVKSDLLRDFMMTYTTTASVRVHAEIVHNAAVKRKAAKFGLRLACGEDTLEKTISNLQELQRNVSSEALTPSEMVQRFADYVVKVDSGEKLPFLPTGFNDLDKILGGGFVDGGLITLAARPGAGKTTVALNLAELIAAKGGKVLYISLEMPYFQLLARRAGILKGLSFGKILNGSMNDNEWERFTQAEEIMCKEDFLIIDKPCTIADIERHIRVNASGLSAVFIDHIGLITNPKGGTRYEFMTNTVHQLKQIALSTGVPIVGLCQLNRMAESRNNKKPTLADLRDSGAIEEDSDVVGLIFREGMYLPEENKPKPWENQPLEIYIDKNRHSMQGVVRFSFCGLNARILPEG